jgi:hypothetical protein
MSNEDEIYRRLLAAARVDIAPRIRDSSDPLNAPVAFLDDLIALIRVELGRRIARAAGFVERNRILGTVSLSAANRNSLLEGIRAESQRLRFFGIRQRITAVVDYSVRTMIDWNPSGARAAVTSGSERVDEQLEEDPLALVPPRPPVHPAPPGGDPLVNALARFASGGMRLLRGYIGESEVAGYRRLYSSLELTDYLDIPADAIIRTVDLRTNSNPLGGAAVWIRVGAEVYRGRTNVSKTEIQGNFLAGGMGRWGGRAEDITPFGRGEDITPFGRGEDITPFGRGEDITPFGR